MQKQTIFEAYVVVFHVHKGKYNDFALLKMQIKLNILQHQHAFYCKRRNRW